MQQHRPGKQHAITVQLHPDEKSQFDNKTNSLIEAISPHQHQLHNKHEVLNQIGWSRIDDSAPGHWHVDEIQSDMQHADKIKNMAKARAKHIDLNDDDIDKVHSALSGNHEDPQHLIHSAVNALGRKLNLNSTSMDMPEDQAAQSALVDRRNAIDYVEPDYDRWDNLDQEFYAKHLNQENWNNLIQNHPNHYLRSALQKINPDLLKENYSYGGSMPSDSLTDNPLIQSEMNKLSDPERDSLIDHLSNLDNSFERNEYVDNIYAEAANNAQQEDAPKDEKRKLPVHQIDTYDKRPRKLGMKPIDKASVLGEHPTDKAKQIQYSELYKNLKEILERLRK